MKCSRRARDLWSEWPCLSVPLSEGERGWLRFVTRLSTMDDMGANINSLCRNTAHIHVCMTVAANQRSFQPSSAILLTPHCSKREKRSRYHLGFSANFELWCRSRLNKHSVQLSMRHVQHVMYTHCFRMCTKTVYMFSLRKKKQATACK